MDLEKLSDQTSLQFTKVLDQRYANKFLSIIIPTYNEANNLPELIERINCVMKDENVDIIIVDDGSPDGTASIAQKLNEVYGNVNVLTRNRRLGLGSAIKDGMCVSKAEVFAVMDADLQHPPEILKNMYEKIKDGFDIVVASRYVDGGGIEKWSIWRIIMSIVATKLAHLLLPKTRKVRDPLSGYFMLRGHIVKNIRLNANGFKILLEILVKGSYDLIAEMPYVFKPRRAGKSKLHLKEIMNYLKLLLELMLNPK
jgi:dolichol-phosphate mannosyltransferase